VEGFGQIPSDNYQLVFIAGFFFQMSSDKYQPVFIAGHPNTVALSQRVDGASACECC